MRHSLSPPYKHTHVPWSIITEYYLLTGLGIDTFKPYKMYLTTLQIVQFLVLLVQSIFMGVRQMQGAPFVDFRCAILQCCLMLQMVFMFSQFFEEMYCKKKSKKA